MIHYFTKTIKNCLFFIIFFTNFSVLFASQIPTKYDTAKNNNLELKKIKIDTFQNLFNQNIIENENIKRRKAEKKIFNLDSLLNKNNKLNFDSLNIDRSTLTDSMFLILDSIKKSQDPRFYKSSNKIKAPVNYDAKDSLVLNLNSKIITMFGGSKTTYEKIELNADKIDYNIPNNIVGGYAQRDSLGNVIGKPTFKDNSTEFKFEDLKYNYTTQKGYINKIVTKERDGFIHGKEVFKDTGNTFFIKKGNFTTCDLDHPHFSIRASKIGLTAKRALITSEAVMYIDESFFPIGIPFGFFPNQNKASAGILFPKWGESIARGIFINNFGLYIPIKNYLDFTFLADYYFKTQDFNLSARINYAKKYKFIGNFSFAYNAINTGFKDLPTFNSNNSFKIHLDHKQDPKANPYSNISASIDFSNSATYYRDNFNVRPEDYLKSNINSSLSYSLNIPNSQVKMSINVNADVNPTNKLLKITLPTYNLNVNRVNPFKRKNRVGEEKFYEKIGFSYALNLENSITIADSLLFNSDIGKKMKNGIKHTIPFSFSSIKILKYLNFSPSFNYTEVWYLNTIKRRLDVPTNKVITDTVYDFDRAGYFSTGASLATQIYGMVQFKKGPIKAIRHVLTPNISFSYTPDFADPLFNYYGEYYSDTTQKKKIVKYSRFENGFYGGPGSGESGNLSFAFGNILEMKVKKKSTPSKNTDAKKEDEYHKISLLESFNLSTGYDIIKDVWSPLSITANTTLFKLVRVNYSSSYDFYSLDNTGNKSKKFEFEKTGYLMRFVNSNLNMAVGYTFSSRKSPPVVSSADEFEQIRNNFKIPWSLSFSYTFTLATSVVNNKIKEVVTNSLSFNTKIDLTNKLKLSFSSGYNFDLGTFTFTNFNITRDLHCWEITLNVVPFGDRQSYNFMLKAKSATLNDLKLPRDRNWSDR